MGEGLRRGLAWRRILLQPLPRARKGKEKSSINENHQVFFHKIGTPQSADRLVFEDKDHPLRFHIVSTTEDERFAILNVSDRGTGKDGNAIFVRDLASGATTFVPVIGDITDSTFDVIDNVGDKLLIVTDHKAPNMRVVLVDPKAPAEASGKRCSLKTGAAQGATTAVESCS